MNKIRSGQSIENFETVRVTKGGERLNVSLTISPVRDESGKIVGASTIMRDITIKKRIEASLLQAEKISAAGRMAATIAHEVNNPLEALINLIFLARSNAEDAERVRSLLQTAESEVVRISHLARQTLGFYRENAQMERVCLSDLIVEVLRIYEPKCQQGGITIKKESASRRQVLIRKGELIQVSSNLVSNAIYAMNSGGELCISVADVASPTPGVVLTVKDNGCGISPEYLPKIFDAFFSTWHNRHRHWSVRRKTVCRGPRRKN